MGLDAKKPTMIYTDMIDLNYVWLSSSLVKYRDFSVPLWFELGIGLE